MNQDLQKTFAERNKIYDLDVTELYRAIEVRLLPLLPGGRRDRISLLYDRLARIESGQDGSREAEQLILNQIALRKNGRRFFQKVQIANNVVKIPWYIIYLYENSNCIVRSLEPLAAGKSNAKYRFDFYSHAGEFLKELNDSGFRLAGDSVLIDLANAIDYEFWIIGKFINKN
jgi:hypothetical protein